MSKHTPGNWTWTRKGCTIESDGRPGKRATLVKVAVGFIDEEELEANGRLIAAAPEMLEALKDWLQLADEAVRNYGEDMVHPKERGVIRSARAAIAKAEGRQ